MFDFFVGKISGEFGEIGLGVEELGAIELRISEWGMKIRRKGELVNG